ncbi:glutathione S-transferase [Actibacterium sp. XHP0104]|uniref:glutathione S-transferase n=1 Tax=Actibacterium sp. XHP0104 TaxID=2984335 RepID=UPI0021E78BFC|nr:glutathione S-transferase [Actibacterium sp. XHP0104]MCV2882000.1 glutathione S-transferase [Actibacterium sp. XHP0104]
MKLYHSPTSPFARKVRMVLLETGLDAGVEKQVGSGTPVDPGQAPLTENPLGKIPVLTRRDGPPIYDSRVICRYLDARAQAGLYPAEPDLWEVLTAEALADGIMEAAVLMVYETRVRPEELRFTPWVEGQWAKIDRSLGDLNSRWIMWLNRPMTMGHIAVACALGYLDFRHPARNWRASYPDLAQWFEGFATRDSFVTTTPPQAT